jgi:ribonuclease HI
MASARVEQHVLFLMMQLVVMSVIDFGLGCLTLSNRQTQRLDRLQNEAMRAVLGCTRDTHIICMRYLLDLPSIGVRHKIAQAKMYLKVAEDESHPLHHTIKKDKGSRLKRGRSWMAEAEDSLRKVCELEDIKIGKEWIQLADEGRNLTNVVITMGREQREVADIVTDQEILSLISEHSKPDDPVIYTDGSVRRDVQSGWGFVVLQRNKVVYTTSGATTATTSSMRMEVVAISKALEWIRISRPGSTHLVFVTDSQSTLRKIQRNMLRSEWIDAIKGSDVRSIVWIFCPGHAGVKGNEAADKLAGAATANESIQMDRADIIDKLSRKLKEEDNRDMDDHYAVARMREMGVDHGSGRRSRLAGRERRLDNQIKTGTISMDSLRMALGRGTEHLWTCPQCNDAEAPPSNNQVITRRVEDRESLRVISSQPQRR